MQAFGVRADKIEASLESRSIDFEVWPENWDALQLFLACETQWHYVGQGQPVRLDYTSVDAVMRIHRVRDRAAMLEKIRLLERGALNQIRSKRR